MAATSAVKYTYRVGSISEYDAKHVSVALIQQDEDRPVSAAPAPYTPGPGSWTVVVPKDKAADFLPGDTYTVTFTKN